MANPRNEGPDKKNRNTQEERGIPGGPEVRSSLDDNVDEEALKQDTSFIEIPDVRDIPGQENITAAPLGDLADTTLSSDDEEGINGGQDILEDDDEVKIVMGTEADVTAEDLLILGDRDRNLDMGDDEMTGIEGLDDTDFDGEPLNEAPTNLASTGDDLDIPETDGSNPTQDAMGQGDEENDYYSLGSDDNDNLTEGTP